MTGPQPSEVLDAAHLYSYASHATHRVDGGLLLRADVHRMFDRLLLTLDPETMTSQVAPSLLDRYENLRALDRRPVLVPDGAAPDLALLGEHAVLARQRWRDLL